MEMTDFSRHIYDALTAIVSEQIADSIIIPCTLLVIAGMAVASYYICVRILTPLTNLFTKATTTEWDNDILDHKFLSAVSKLAPAIILAWLLPQVANGHEAWTQWLTKICYIYIAYTVVRLVNVFLQNIYNGIEKRKMYREHNLSVVVQALKLVVICLGAVVCIGILFGRSPLAVLTALGASAAILMLVFKDTIMGLVAGVQLSANGMLHKGDWIISEKAHANGEVLDVKLTTVKVRNWDNSITTIPPYTLVSDSFQNYQNMRKAGARRVARSIYIDINTIGFLDNNALERLKAKGLTDGIPDTEKNRVVNLTLLRRYLESYLSSHPAIRKEDKRNPAIFMMVRQLQPTSNGLPIELYFFTYETNWKKFEELQSDIFDHVYAVVSEFGLKMYQSPAGADIRYRLEDNDSCNAITPRQ